MGRGEVRGATMVMHLGYRGAGFSGWAEQPGRRTVADELREALTTVLRRPIEMEVAGRTDAGVHALGQYASVPITVEEATLPGRRLRSSIVALTPDDLALRGLYQAPRGFSARLDAQGRHYRYRLVCGMARPVMAWGHAWWIRGIERLDVGAMACAAQALVGEHDFTSFCKATSAELLIRGGRSLCRNLTSIEVAQVCEAGEELVVVDVRGNAFLHNMVRIIVGSLVEVGRGQRDARWLADALAARDRRAAGPTAPAEGLTLVGVDYPSGPLTPWR